MKLGHVKLLAVSFPSWHINPEFPQGTQAWMWVFPEPLEYFWSCTQILNITWSARPCWVPPVVFPSEGWSSWWTTSMSEGGGLLLPLEVQPADKTLLPFLHHNLVVNSASENIHLQLSSGWWDSTGPSKNFSYHKCLPALWSRSPYNLSGWVSFNLHEKWKARWVKESNSVT